MAGPVIPEERVHKLVEGPSEDARYVLYWMQSSVRAEQNSALEYAARLANKLHKPLVACFGLTPDYPEAVMRHYTFLLDGLRAAASGLRRRKVKLVVRVGEPDEVAAELAADACAVVTDYGYLRHQRRWRRRLRAALKIPFTAVEGDVAVPVAVASGKREYAARTLRPKLQEWLDAFLIEVPAITLECSSLSLNLRTERLSDALLTRLEVDDSVPPVRTRFEGGTYQARACLRRFLEQGLAGYGDRRNQMQTEGGSQLAMYINYGHISPVSVALAVKRSDAPETDKDAFLEELIVRRELAINYVHYEPDYDCFRALPEWARDTLTAHRGDERPYRYTRTELQDAATHDRYWNAAMLELKETGYMHNHMRMYWGKKILEWSNAPEYAFRTALYLNNRYGLDGRSPGAFANVAWVFGLHDQAWSERSVFGKVRYMNAAGLERKADPDAYVARVEAATGSEVQG